MVIKTLIATLAVVSLSGCIAYTPVKMAVDEVCASSEARKAVMAEEMDAATFPHKLRVQCAESNAPIQITGDAE